MDYWTRMEAKRNNYTEIKKQTKKMKTTTKRLHDLLFVVILSLFQFVDSVHCLEATVLYIIQVTEHIVSTELLLWPTLYQTSV